jgi:hypothetical protein
MARQTTNDEGLTHLLLDLKVLNNGLADKISNSYSDGEFGCCADSGGRDGRLFFGDVSAGDERTVHVSDGHSCCCECMLHAHNRVAYTYTGRR